MNNEIKTSAESSTPLSIDELDQAAGGSGGAPADYKVMGMTAEEAGMFFQNG